MDFEGKVVVVTGATSGIGRATALGFAGEGAKVAATGRRVEMLEVLQGECTSILTYQADLAVEAMATSFIDKVNRDLGGIDVLVNSAGIMALGELGEMSLSEYDRMMNINVRSVIHLMQLCLPSIIKNKGNVVNVSSVTGLRAFPGLLAYCVSKAAIDQLTRCSALELASKGVRVNAVNPGVVRTNLHLEAGMSNNSYENFIKHSNTTHPIGRIGKASEVADLIMYLASNRAGWITGATYSIDGGRSETCAR